MAKIHTLARRTGAEESGADTALVDALRRLGFTDHEARTYVALTRSYPATAYEVSKSAELPRANVYNVLRTLQAKQAIQPVTEDPIRYAPVDPEQFFGRIEEATTTLCHDVVQRMKQRAPSDDDVYVWVSLGRGQVVKKIKELVASAKTDLWIKVAAHVLEPVIDDVVQAADRGVNLKVILYGDVPGRIANHPRIKIFRHEGGGERQGISDVLLTMTVDLRSVMIASFTGRITGSYARNPSITYVTQTYLLHEMYLADIYAAMGDELDARFGKGLEKLRRKYRPPDMERYVIKKAGTEVQ